MPPIRVWFVGLRALIVAMGGVLVAQYAHLSGTATRISAAAWVIATMTGLTAAANSMHAAWPPTPPEPRAYDES